MKKSFYHLSCIHCQKKTSEDKTTSLCLSCSGPLDVVYDYEYLMSRVNKYVLRTTPPKVIKYLDLLPLKNDHHIITLEEGGTPLSLSKNLGSKLGLSNLFIKIEGLNPTGAFKDRGSFVEINKALELGFTAICVASTGNMAASVAAYSVQAGLPCYIFVPDSTPRSKLAQCLSYGANVIQVRGTYDDAFTLASQAAAEYNFYLAGDYAFRLEGQKTTAYEIVEQSFLKPPDFVVVPMGMGTNIAAIWKGLKEYHQLGLLKRLPKLIGIQAEGCKPIVDAFSKKKKLIYVDKPNTVSSAIAVGKPIDADKALTALSKSGGFALAVSDDETLKAQQELAKHEGIYVEPASATSIAAVLKLAKKKKFEQEDRIICITTGTGLKDPSTTLKILAEPPVIEPKLEEVTRVISGNLFAIRALGMVEQEKILFRKVPSSHLLRKVIRKDFNLKPRELNMIFIRSEIREFINKGKVISKADLQAIIETAMQHVLKKKYLEVLDFDIHDRKKGKAQAWVKMKLNGKIHQARASGDGPVDAAISALRKKLKQNGKVIFELMDYNVEVTSTGTDAVVIVSIVLKDKKGNEVVARQTSPDIILASIEAFELGYNELAAKAK